MSAMGVISGSGPVRWVVLDTVIPLSICELSNHQRGVARDARTPLGVSPLAIKRPAAYGCGDRWSCQPRPQVL